jgi:hypothetical protein
MGEEIGLRQELFARKVALTFAVFNLNAQSETQYNPDVGQDSAGPASRRYGYELNITYQALRWLEFYGTPSRRITRGSRHPSTMALDTSATTCPMRRSPRGPLQPI